MAHAVRVLGAPPSGTAFGLAGLRAEDARTAAEVTARLRTLLDDPDIGVVLVEASVYDALPPDMRKLLGRRPLPMIVPFPGPAWQARPTDAEAYIVELLRQVIGYRVRLR